MAVEYTAGRALSAQADLERLSDALAGQYAFPESAGGAVTPSSGMTLAVAAITGNKVTIEGDLVATGYAGGTVNIPASDTDYPRRDLIYYDDTGAVGVEEGVPLPLTTTSGPVPPTLDDDQIAVAEVYVAANATSISSGDITDRRQGIRATYADTVAKYKTAAQAFTTNTTFADITASSGNFAFDIGANEVWVAQYVIPITFRSLSDTGGVKIQLTGPAAPTKVMLSGTVNRVVDGVSVQAMSPLTPATAFSSAVGAGDSSNGGTGPYHTGNPPKFFLDLLVVNGSTAGTVTLQGAQNSANGTTDFSADCWMTARRVA